MIFARFRYAAIALAALAIGLIASQGAWSDDDNAVKPATEPKLKESFMPPADADVAQLRQFMQDLEKEVAQAQELQMKAPVGLRAAAKKILELEQDHGSEAYREAWETLLPVQMMKLTKEMPDAETQALLDEMKQMFASSRKLTIKQCRLAQGFASRLDNMDKTEAAIAAYEAFSPLFSQSDDPMVKKTAESMAGAAMRLKLPGHEMEIVGTTTDGEPFDWSKYKGKVVLVDFWATWCGPCMAELPNVKYNYKKYHDLGFEVVGVSIDQDRKALDAYLEKDKLPWVILNEKGAGWNSAIARKYGVTSIPTVILIDRDGKVVSLEARGVELIMQLEKLLGPAPPVSPEKQTAQAGG